MSKTILALDATTEVCSVALMGGERILEETCSRPRSHAQVLLPMVDKLLHEFDINLSDLDVITLTNGPGSFTGIRICIGIAQGLAYGAGVPLLTWSTLDTMAVQVSQEFRIDEGKPLIVALDARMGEIYWAAYNNMTNGLPERLVEPRVSAISEFDLWVEKNISEPFVGVGHGWTLVAREYFADQEIHSAFQPRASGILYAMSRLQAAGEEFLTLSPETIIEPLYLRNEITWEKRKRIRQQ